MIEAKDFVMDLFQLVKFHLLRMNTNLCKILPICKLHMYVQPVNQCSQKKKSTLSVYVKVERVCTRTWMSRCRYMYGTAMIAHKY